MKRRPPPRHSVRRHRALELHSPPSSDQALATSAVRGVTVLGAERATYQILTATVFVVLGRLLTPNQFGLVAAANVFIVLLRTFADAGMGRALVRIPVLRNVDITTAFWTAVVMGTLLALLSLAMAPLVAVLFDQPRLTTVIRVLSILFIFAGLDSTQSALADRALNFRVQAVRRFHSLGA